MNDQERIENQIDEENYERQDCLRKGKYFSKRHIMEMYCMDDEEIHGLR